MKSATGQPKMIAPGVYLIDTGFIRPQVNANYLIYDGLTAAIVETGSSTTVPVLLEAIDSLGFQREKIQYVIVTHVHLDHAGGAGLLLRELPQARLVVHPRGARHMIDPSQLIAGTRTIYGGTEFKRLYGNVLPVPEDRLIEAPDGFTLPVAGRVLSFLHTPGHAQHHLVVLDPTTHGIFTGDTFGVCYREFNQDRQPFVFPMTTPVQFNPAALHQSLDRILQQSPHQLFLTHYGRITGDLCELVVKMHRLIDAFVAIALRYQDEEERLAKIYEALVKLLLSELRTHGSSLSRAQALKTWELDLKLNAQGLETWLERRS